MSAASLPAFPSARMRRLRRDAFSRNMVRETSLAAANLIWPVFVIEGERRTQAVASMPGVERVSIDLLVERAGEAAALRVSAQAARLPPVQSGGRELRKLVNKAPLPQAGGVWGWARA